MPALAQRPKLSTVRYILLDIILGLVLGCVLALAIGKIPMAKTNSENVPVRTVTITIVPSWKNELFAKLRNFADIWNYAVLIAPSDQSNEYYNVQLWRFDMKLIGVYSAASGKLELGFYNTHPNGRNPWWFFDDELDELRKLIHKIPQSTFSVEK